MRARAAAAVFAWAALAASQAGAGSLEEIDAALSKLPKACAVDADCATVGVGSRPCGGPAGYAAHAASASGRARELARLRLAAEARAKRGERGELAGSCMALEDPGAACRAGSCELRRAPGLGRPVPEPPGPG